MVVEQGGSTYMAALDGNVFGVFTPTILPAYRAVSEIFAQRNTEFGQLGPPAGSVNPFIRTLTPLPARGRRCLRASYRVYVRGVRPACISSGLRAHWWGEVAAGGEARLRRGSRESACGVMWLA